MIEYNHSNHSNHSSPLQTHLTLPRHQWRHDNGVQSRDSYEYDRHSGSGDVYPPAQVHQENFIQKKYEPVHHPR